MIDIPVENFVFLVCTLVGGGLLLLTVLLDDILGAIFDFDVAGTSLMPLMLSFIAMFGVGGLFATQILDVHGGQAALVGTIFGLVGMAIAWGMFTMLRRAQAGAVLDQGPDRRRRLRGGRHPGQPVRQCWSEGRPDPRVQRDCQHGHRIGATARVSGSPAGLIVEP